ncbi:hypothetical protein ACFC25_12445, partial [Pseudarthrobacter sp. NPDC055928]|uniref:hypothetical protein n=1 Tax=Pseudarthrobacter sp. NPDC055928 TaxID=3345661 RepID=UPI0035E3254D
MPNFFCDRHHQDRLKTQSTLPEDRRRFGFAGCLRNRLLTSSNIGLSKGPGYPELLPESWTEKSVLTFGEQFYAWKKYVVRGAA